MWYAPTFEIRYAGSDGAVLRLAQETVARTDPALTVFQAKTLEVQTEESLSRERLLAVLAGYMGGFAVLLACIVGPVAEELFFRGVVYAAVRRRTHWMVATLVSAGLFSALHTNPIGFLPIMLLGCLLANLYERTGSLAGPLAVHIAHNSFLLVSALVIRSLLGG